MNKKLIFVDKVPKDIRLHPRYSEYGADAEGNVYSFKHRKPVKLQPTTLQTGYLQIDTRSPEGIRKHFLVHRFIFECFHGEVPYPFEVCHNDGSRDHNNIVNLRMDTHKSNIADKKRHGTAQVGVNHPSHKITEAQVLSIREARGKGLSLQSIATTNGISKHQVWRIVIGKAWTHLQREERK